MPTPAMTHAERSVHRGRALRAILIDDHPAKSVAAETGIKCSTLYNALSNAGYRVMHLSAAERLFILNLRKIDPAINKILNAI